MVYQRAFQEQKISASFANEITREQPYGGENEDMLLTITIFKEERRYSMHLEDPVAFFFFTTLATIVTKTHNLFR
jgi:hypothetical protein